MAECKTDFAMQFPPVERRASMAISQPRPLPRYYAVLLASTIPCRQVAGQTLSPMKKLIVAVADVPLLMGTYNLLLRNGTTASRETAAASLFLQKVFAAFVRRPADGLKTTFNWPTFNAAEPTLIKLFVNGAPSGTLGSSAVYDGVCKSNPRFDWAAVLNPPPSC